MDELREAHRGNIAVAESGGLPLLPGRPIFQSPQVLDMYLATTQPKKFEEIKAPLEAQTKSIRLSSAVETLGWWPCDPELSGTYIGNAAGKILCLADRIYNHHSDGYERYHRSLARRGKDPRYCIKQAADGGFSKIKIFSHEREYMPSAHKAGPISWPGPELGPVMDAHGGVAGYFRDLKRMVLRREQEEGLETDLDGHDEVTYMFFRPERRMEDIRVYSFSARVPVTFLLDPEDYSGEVLTSYHFMKMRGEDAPVSLRGKSIVQIKDEYLRHHSPMAHAMRAFMDAVHVPRTVHPSFRMKANPAPRAFVVSTQDNYSNSAVPANQPLSFDPAAKLGVSRAHYNRLEEGSLMCMAAGNDAVVLHDKTVPKSRADILAFKDLLFTSVVDRQVCVEEAAGKPLIVLQKPDSSFYSDSFAEGKMDWDDPKVERAFLEYLDAVDTKKNPWQRDLMLIRYMHEKGFIKQEEHHLFTQIDPAAHNAAARISEKIRSELPNRMEAPNYEGDSWGHDRRDKFEVFIAGSAGTHGQEYIDQAEKLAYWAASKGFHVRTGGGNFGIMGAAARGVQRFIKEHPEHANDTHLSLIQTYRTVQFEGAAVTPCDIKKMPYVHLAIEKNFDARMESLFRVSGEDAHNPSIGTANVFMAGGVGTLQEAIRWMRFKESGVTHMQGKKMIWFNQRQAGDETGQRIRVLDAMVHSFPKEIRDEHIDARLSLEGVQRAIMTQYGAWALQPGRHAHITLSQRPALQL